MRFRNVILSVLTAAAVLALTALRVDAKPEFSKKEKTPCTTCHVSAKSKDLNDVGKEYKEKKVLPKKK